ncbi:MAG TPA: DUF3298 and DUF4163 domain-containing protein [Clostridiales bacterium]|nr:DUF3298 and DUF4163 domain-containing protein [Clostridiales bacterium]
MIEYSLQVEERILHQELYYKENKVMTYTIKYPEFYSEEFALIVDKLNVLYRTKANVYEKTVVNNLYQQAMVEYEYSVANGFPIRAFEVYADYNISYNKNCSLSLYFDQYEYTGGAHGMTVRTSDTWDLIRSNMMKLKDFFICDDAYQEYIITNISLQIAEQIIAGDDMYFDDYFHLVRENFKPNNFYLVDEGIVIYYGLYDIAPYAAGMRTFLIPFRKGIVLEPSCNN